MSPVLTFENEIVIKINNKIISSIDINIESDYLIALNPNLDSLKNDEIKEIAKNSLIRETIKDLELQKYKNLKINTSHLQNIIVSIYQNIGLNNEDEFIRYLETKNINIEFVKEKLTKEAIWNQLIYNKFFSKIKIDKKKIENDLKNMKKTSRTFLLHEIVFNAENSSEKKKIFDQIKNSIDKNGFENTASIYSISSTSKTGGKLGWISEKSLNKKILESINNLKINEFTDPVIVPGGFLILIVKDRKIVEEKIDEKKNFALIVRRMQNQQLNQYSNIYFNKIKKDIYLDAK
ncbi:peptidylprolyl isomerase [Candidatus Pelagibacter sp.]|uniref:peptidylprolyl isomerase n=1 Tax=Candidatus Pelagibacter sp. TaxID=2024849 RepID=UPI003F86D551